MENLKRTQLVLLLLCGLFSAHAQYYSTDETTIGILVEPTFSGFGYNGLTPSITIGCSTYQLQFGPRLSFQKMIGNTPAKEQDMVYDFGYRYSFVQHYGLAVFAAIRCEYGTYKYTYDWNYTDASTTDSPALGNIPLDIRTTEKQYNLNTYLGFGAEQITVDKLYFTLFGGAGIKTLTGYEQHIDRNTGEIAGETNWLFDKQGWSWMISGGIGYRL